MSWEMLSAMATLAGLIAAGLGLYVRLAVRSALNEFKVELLESLNGRYFLRREAEVLFAEFERRLSSRGH